GCILYCSLLPDKSYDYVLEPSPVALPLIQPQQTRVVQVSCGRAHSLILTDQEGVFSMGNNAYGQCGRSIIDEEVYRSVVAPKNMFSTEKAPLPCRRLDYF
ncbi:PREDICTED: Williams-Beuren syndrome chromosomal region 16 protein-like, partial [Cyprinodon variegatus]|uniref:Williams-Beuren syndrome chromosomal region 16 protein-like n=1 Tax=Cyprinodon variegatus TaxID=28743 RepID=UPI000742608A